MCAVGLADASYRSAPLGLDIDKLVWSYRVSCEVPSHDAHGIKTEASPRARPARFFELVQTLTFLALRRAYFSVIDNFFCGLMP